jgi:hypothetical protein
MTAFNFHIDLGPAYQKVLWLEQMGEKAFVEVTRRAGMRSAILVQMTMKSFIERGLESWPANHPFTIAMKGKDQPLVETGAMADEITIFMSRKGGGFEYLVGFPQGKYSMIAENNEFGRTITVTAKMRRFLAANGMALKADTKVLFIPPRPFMEPAFSLNMDQIGQIANEEIRSVFVEHQLESRGVRFVLGANLPGAAKQGPSLRGNTGGRLARIVRALNSR